MKSMQQLMDELTPDDLTWMQTHWEGKLEQVFTHYEVETAITRHIQVTRLWEAINADRVTVSQRMMAIPDDLYQNICANQGIERDHLAAITPDDAAFEPALAIEFDGGTRHIIVDGNHKIVRAYEMGLRRRPALFVAASDLDPFLVHPPATVSALMVAFTRANVPHGPEAAKLCPKCQQPVRPEPCPAHDADCPYIYS